MAEIKHLVSEDLVRQLASEQAARDLKEALHSALEEEDDDALARRDPEPISTYRLWTYARRDAGAPVSFEIEGRLRSDEATARRYRQILTSRSQGHSLTAMAAGTGQFPERQIGDFFLRVVDEGDATYIVISSAQGSDQMPSMLEARGRDDSARVPLPGAIRGHIQMIADRKDGQMNTLLDLLGAPDTELFLF